MNKNLLLLLFSFFAIFCSGQRNRSAIDKIVEEELKAFPEVGLVIGISKGSKTEYYAYGTRSKESKAKMDSLTVFEIGSATKTFTSLLLAQEIAKGNMGAFDFIDSYLPSTIMLNCEVRKKVLLTDLATHQSGLPNLSGDTYFSDLIQQDPSNPFRFVDENYLFKVLKETDSLSGYRQYQYNNYAFSLLGNILERKLKIPYESLIEKQILKPLKMNSTSFNTLKTQNRAGLYNQQGVPQQPIVLNKVNPAGGLTSNAVDLMRYIKAYLFNKDFAAARAVTEKTYYEDSKRKLGLGWEMGSDFLEKDGDTFGNSSLIRYSVKNQIGMVVLSNHQNGRLVKNLMNRIYQQFK
ncbi:serine hydrolase [uncultured Chryseobacterium sp.]|uniref:serine hydrolase domain-containing protein n=1 Tax=uncultured Chryseobacterium sp. TaxID=259322 RepID=UPI0025D84E14|nr:serine hydrolase [uncultured Chryseobacterium sp.]